MTTQVDSINAGYYVIPQNYQNASLNQQQIDPASLQYQQALQNDTVSFSGRGEEKKNKHTGLKVVLGLAGTAIAAYFLHKNWGSFKKLFDGIFHPAKKQALKMAESINQKATTSAEKIDKAFGLDKTSKKAAKAVRKRTLNDALHTNWDGPVTKRHLTKEDALKAAKEIKQKATTTAKEIDKYLGIDKASKAGRNRALDNVARTNWDGPILKRHP